MNNYRNITYWENKRRLSRLIEFQNYVVAYLKIVKMNDTRIENEKAKKCRREINLMNSEIHQIFHASSIPPKITWTPPTARGGYIQDVDVLDNLFILFQFSIPDNMVTDFLERSIGVYKTDQRNSIFRTLNPFWWIGRSLKWFARLPFSLVGAAGFDATKAEGSIFGRLAKAILMVIPVIASLLAILDRMGWLEVVKSMFGIGV